MAKPITSYVFVVVFVRLGRRFLMVQERKHDQTWYLPAGAVDPGEKVEDAALREVHEETGLNVHLEGILAIQYTPARHETRLRMIFSAHAVDDEVPRATPNQHTLQSRWTTVDEARQLSLRDPTIPDQFQSILDGRLVVPVGFVAPE